MHDVQSHMIHAKLEHEITNGLSSRGAIINQQYAVDW